ncbi:hypothetical protein GA0061099_100512 [Bradyrhizobium yuanmingense]|uniref:Uncharacterized protein n=1 Tax=Bradyrhizobium yuanmingense TaxID=108015 RepID=A0A1C3VZZ5_9BRAD|nr:hypothetical protein [Bradyrhizobium yuanmingense]TWI27772.1 hypothetical protein IQ15_03312 [Bradyrhizobium yuanmingense]SCB33332.1 hypothetical protein GA0061099_100512 [Bradyrhizobium yuanmingense]
MRHDTEGLDVATLFADDHQLASHPSAAADQQPQDPPARPDVPHEPPPEIKKAMLAAAYAEQMIERLAALQNEQVIKYTGISRVELGLRVWNAPLAEVAGRLGLKKHVLRRVCTLFEVPIPPKGYFNTGFAHRSIRWTRVAGGAGMR